MRNYENVDVSNPAPRIPVVLVLDTSRSMKGEPIQKLKEGLQQFVKEVSNDEAASMSVELEIIPMTESAEPLIQFSQTWEIETKKINPVAKYGTYTGKALQRTLEDLNARIELYQSKGIQYYRPWVIMMTDGKPGDQWKEQADILCDLASQDRIVYLGVGIGEKCDFNILKQMLPAVPGPVKLPGLKFREFFRFISGSLSSVSCSADGYDDVSNGRIMKWEDLV